MTDCVYCGKDAGAYDEHEDCVQAAFVEVATVEELRREVRRLEIMNEALIDAGKAVVAERDELRARCDRYERALYPQTHEQADVLARDDGPPADAPGEPS